MTKMSGIEGIGIKVIGTAEPAEASAALDAMEVLQQIAAMIETLVASGESDMIDLQDAQLAPQEYETLREALAEGEVRAVIDTVEPVEVRETIYPGVWWFTQYNVEGDIVADIIEVTPLPEVLKAHADDVADGLARLKEFIRPETSV
jgi:hydrogenase-1 operon protein HyaF